MPEDKRPKLCALMTNADDLMPTRGRRTDLTFRYEAFRAVAAGVVETASGTFLLLIAVRWFEAGSFAKGCIAAGSGLGYLLAPVLVTAVEASRLPVALAAAHLAAAGAAALGLAALVPHLVVFVVGSMTGIAAAGAMHPLLTQIYQDNYPARARGRFFSRTMVIRIASAAAFSAGAGSLLAADLRAFRVVLAIFAAALAFSSWCLRRIPSAELHVSGGRHPFRALRHVRHDAVFRTTLIAWMLMGFANLMMLPLRVEYLANPVYALAMPADMIALLTGVVPNLARLVMSPIWGWLFDRANFFVLRISLNVGFAIGVASFFTSETLGGLLFAAVVQGISSAGGDLAWSLWVTKIAPAPRVAEYMSVHAFFTGVRGLVAPMVGFYLVTYWSVTAMGFVAAGLILAASAVLVPAARRHEPMRPSAAPTTPPSPVDQGQP
jgi:hypothetical protein